MSKASMLRILIGIAVVMPVGLFGQIKIGYIDSNSIMEKLEEVRDARAKLEKETRRLQAEYNTLIGGLDSLQREFERQRLLLSNEKVREKESEMQSHYALTQQFQQTKFGPDGELYRYQAQLMAPILEKIDLAVKAIGAERSYDFIMDAARGGMVYALPAHDLTSVIIVELRRSVSK